jgi:type I restriction enzyme S subunit
MAKQNKPAIRFKGFTDAWEQRKVGDLLIERNQQAPMSDEYPLMAFIANEGVAPKGARYDRSALVTDTVNKLYKKTEKGDFIYSSNNLETGSIGLNKYGKACISPVYSIFEPTGIADSDFLGRRLVRKDFINAMVKWRQGVIYGQWRIHESDFLKIEITVPSVEEQRKIGAYLDQLDNLITLHQRKFDKLQVLKKAMLEKMFPKNGSSVPEIRFKGFTDAWEQRKVSEVAEICAGGTPSTGIEKYWHPKEIPWLSSGEVHKKYITYTDNKISVEGLNNSSARMIPANSVLIALAGQGKTRGTVAINRISLTTNQSIAAMIFSKEIVPEFVFCNLENRYEEIRRMSSGDGSRGGLNKQIVGEIEIPYTSKEEQAKIGAYFSKLDYLITLHQRKSYIYGLSNFI